MAITNTKQLYVRYTIKTIHNETMKCNHWIYANTYTHLDYFYVTAVSFVETITYTTWLVYDSKLLQLFFKQLHFLLTFYNHHQKMKYVLNSAISIISDHFGVNINLPLSKVMV